MDGNGRWAESRGLMRFMGHDEGIKTFEKTLEWCIEEEIPFLSVYAFSTENWTREPEEVDHIFMLMNKYLKMKQQELIDRGICVNIIGDTTKLDQECIDIVEDISMKTELNRKMSVQLAVNYGGRDEIVRAAKKLYLELQENDMNINDVTEEIFERYLDTSGIPDVDLLIRTGAVKRTSNFLPWQTFYSELFFTDLLWPDFDRHELDGAIEYFMGCERKYGNVNKS